jgi:hypothetical protein
MTEDVSPPGMKKDPRTIALCAVVIAVGLVLCVHAITSALNQLHADEREEILDLDDRSPEELEADRLTHETEALAAEKARLQRECDELSERVAALSSRAPEMPLIETSVVMVEGNDVYLMAGSEDGIQRGFQLSILRNKGFIAHVVVQEVAPRHCMCRVVLQREDTAIKPGDQAFTKLQ